MGTQIWITAPGQIEVRVVADPTPGDGEILVRTQRAGICGSDLHTYRHGHAWLPYPIAPGHEVAGVVEAVGSGVSRVSPGQNIFINPAVTCGSCFYCRTDRTNLCEYLSGIGAHTPGGMSESFVVQESAAWVVPEGMSLLLASLVEPVATAVHAVHLAGGVRGKVVVILGGGTIGLCVLAACIAGGARTTLVSEPSAAKREVALRWDAGAAVDPREGDVHDGVRRELPHRPDIVFDCVGSPDTVEAGMRLASRGGRVVVIGAERGTAHISLGDLQDHEVQIIGSSMYTEKDIARAVELVAQQGSHIGELVTAEYGIDEAVEAFGRAASGQEIKVQLVGDGGG